MNPTIRAAVQNLFENKLNLGKCPSCSACDAMFKNPLMPWYIGDNFYQTKERVLFFGKPHRGTPGEVLESGIIDPSKIVLELIDKSWPYWSYTKHIGEQLYGENGIDYLAMSNIIKCTNVNADKPGKAVDNTSIKMAEACIGNLGVIFEEIEIINPKTLIFYTCGLFPEILVSAIEKKFNRTKIGISSSVKCGKKSLQTRELLIETKSGEHLNALIVGHPERMKKDDFCFYISEWIKAKNP